MKKEINFKMIFTSVEHDKVLFDYWKYNIGKITCMWHVIKQFGGKFFGDSYGFAPNPSIVPK